MFAQLCLLHPSQAERALGWLLRQEVIPEAERVRKVLERKARQKARASGSLSAFAYEALPERRTRGVRVSYDVDAYFAKQLG